MTYSHFTNNKEGYKANRGYIQHIQWSVKKEYKIYIYRRRFQCSIADGSKYYPKNVGSYSKGATNQNGPFSIDFLIQNNLYTTNTFFQHLYTNITTWQNNNYPAYRRNPFRHQMDFILAHTSWKRNNTDAKSLTNFQTHGDHKIVIAKFKIN